MKYLFLFWLRCLAAFAMHQKYRSKKYRASAGIKTG
jgi:hypothetical protein